MLKKLLAVIGIAIFLLGGCAPGSTGVPQETPSGQPPATGAPATQAPATEAPAAETPRQDVFPYSAVATPWSGWTKVPGSAITDAAVASTAFNGKLYLFDKDMVYDLIHFNTYNASNNWSGWEDVPGGVTTDVALSTVVFY
jgi:hypothetical protein